jgi:hypothetical protein
MGRIFGAGNPFWRQETYSADNLGHFLAVLGGGIG